MEEAGVEAGAAGLIGIFRPSEEHRASVVPKRTLSLQFWGPRLASRCCGSWYCRSSLDQLPARIITLAAHNEFLDELHRIGRQKPMPFPRDDCPSSNRHSAAIVYRPARIEDLQRSGELVVCSMNKLCERHGFGPIATVRPPGFSLFSLSDDPNGLWVAEDDGEILGFAFSWVCGRQAISAGACAGSAGRATPSVRRRRAR
jgi:hypothetical protein